MKSKHEQGFTILEIFFALWLGSLVVINCLTVFVTFYHNICLQAALTDITERGRFMAYFFTQQIHLAGNASCLSGQLVNQDQAIRGDPLQLGECIRYHDRVQFLQTQYFIADSGQYDARGKPIFSLYRKISGSPREELVEGISRFTVLYGLALPDQNNIAKYVPASAVSNWQLVHSVDMTFALTSLTLSVEKTWHLYITLRERAQ